MTPDQLELIKNAEAFAAENGLEIELEVLRDMLSHDSDLAHVSFLMRDRYPMPMLEALRARVIEQQSARQPLATIR